MTDGRTDVPRGGDERALLRAYLDFHRETLALKCSGLPDDELRRRSAPPSALSLLGLVRHMAEVERSWFRRVIDGQEVPLVWGEGWDFQAAYDATDAGDEYSLRRVMVHLIQEYARHNGHADLLRERIDAVTGV